MLKAKTDRKWFWRIVDFINPLRDPSLTVAAVLTFIEEAGQHDAWYWIIVVALVNWLAVRGIVWLVVNFTFASTFIMRRVWWAMKHPRLAWRILDAVGHEEIVIGGLPAFGEGMLLPDGSTIYSMSPALSASGIHVIGELPAGTEIPMLNMPNGQMAPNLAAFTSVRFALFDGTLDNPIEAEGVLRTLQCTAGCGRAVPEPNAMLLIGVALGALGLARRRAVVRQRSGYIRRALALGTAHR